MMIVACVYPDFVKFSKMEELRAHLSMVMPIILMVTVVVMTLAARPTAAGSPPLPSLGVIDVTWLLLLVVGVALSMAPNLPTTQGEIKHESYRPILRIWDRLFNAKMYGKSIPECDPIARLGFKGLVFSDLQSLKQYKVKIRLPKNRNHLIGQPGHGKKSSRGFRLKAWVTNSRQALR